METKPDTQPAGQAPALRSGNLFGDARPHSQRPAAFQAWFDRVKKDNECWQLNDSEQAVAFSAFIAGWHLRTGKNPDSFSSPNTQDEPSAANNHQLKTAMKTHKEGHTGALRYARLVRLPLFFFMVLFEILLFLICWGLAYMRPIHARKIHDWAVRTLPDKTWYGLPA